MVQKSQILMMINWDDDVKDEYATKADYYGDKTLYEDFEKS